MPTPFAVPSNARRGRFAGSLLAVLVAASGCSAGPAAGPGSTGPGLTDGGTGPGLTDGGIGGPGTVDGSLGPGGTGGTGGPDGSVGPGGMPGSADAGACNATGPVDTNLPGTSTGTSYVGHQYDYNGVTTTISGQLSTQDAIANSIVADSAQTLKEIAAARATLTYGRIAPDACAPTQLTTYPGPSGITPSNQYRVTVAQNGNPKSSFVYRVLARKKDQYPNREVDTSWTSFSFKGAVTVHVTKLAGVGSVTGCLVRPFSAGIQTQYANGTCTFTVTKPGQLSVEFRPNIHNPVLHPMLVFANPPEVDVPDPSDPNVVYFGPGVHHLGTGQPIKSNETIYLAGGAWVEAAFVASAPVQNVTIRGRGIISGLFFDKGTQTANHNQPGLIDIPSKSSKNVLIAGITLVDAPRFNLRSLAQETTIHNVKEMSWWFNTDGMVGGNKTLIEDSFVKVNDDSIKLHWGDEIVRHNVLWQLENGGTFNMGWNLEQNVQNFYVYDNDVIHAEFYQFEKEAVFRSRQAGAGDLSRYLFDNDRVENANWRLIYLVLENNKWYDPTLGYGQIEQVIFRNIHAYDTSHQRPNVVQGVSGTHKVKNVSFENVYTDGACVSNVSNGHFQIDPNSTNAIRLVKSADGSCHTN